ncbi:MAG: ATP-binding protein [Vicinamibacterales bacterium]
MPGGGSLTLRASQPNAESASLSPAAISVDVTDTGMGMDADALARIFQACFSTKATGTGLGLTIARRNVELLGGTPDHGPGEKGVGRR